jgi:hypothetical protein
VKHAKITAAVAAGFAFVLVLLVAGCGGSSPAPRPGPTPSPKPPCCSPTNRDQKLWNDWLASSNYTDYQAVKTDLAQYAADVQNKDAAAVSADATPLATVATALQSDTSPPYVSTSTSGATDMQLYANYAYEVANNIVTAEQTGQPVTVLDQPSYSNAVASQAAVDKQIQRAQGQ